MQSAYRIPVSRQPVSTQPRVFESLFSITRDEQLVEQYILKPPCFDCRGPTYTTILTDARLIQRTHQKACCGGGTRNDKMVFLSDISMISDYIVRKSCSLGLECLAYSCCCCWCCCCGSSGKSIQFSGPFGTEAFVFAPKDIPDAMYRIPATALPHKTYKMR